MSHRKENLPKAVGVGHLTKKSCLLPAPFRALCSCSADTLTYFQPHSLSRPLLLEPCIHGPSAQTHCPSLCLCFTCRSPTCPSEPGLDNYPSRMCSQSTRACPRGTAALVLRLPTFLSVHTTTLLALGHVFRKHLLSLRMTNYLIIYPQNQVVLQTPSKINIKKCTAGHITIKLQKTKKTKTKSYKQPEKEDKVTANEQ